MKAANPESTTDAFLQLTARRYLEVVALVAIWMVIGRSLRLDANAYLLVGVPLLVVFQSYVRRSPLSQLWVDGVAFALSRRGWMLAAALAVWPGYKLLSAIRSGDGLAINLWLIAATVGAVFAAFAFSEQCRRGKTSKLREAALLLVVGCGVYALSAFLAGRSPLLHPPTLLFVAGQFLLYLPVVFVLEEVVFRGAVDSHISFGAVAGARAWTSALFSGALWGLWHLPILPDVTLPTAVSVVIFHAGFGAPLALLRRTTGTLALPGLVHAAMDAYRNGLFLAPAS